jgi:hypothetical protein
MGRRAVAYALPDIANIKDVDWNLPIVLTET